MSFNFQKSVGWILFLAGIAIIFWSLCSSYNIFTGKVAAPEIFKITEKGAFPLQNGETQDLQSQMEKMIGEQLKGILPADSIPKLLNLLSWSVFVGILIFGGAQISSLGIKLIKK